MVGASFIRDLVYLVREDAAEAAERQSAATAERAAFEAGRALAFVEVLLRMQSQADAFAIPRRDLGLDFDPLEPTALSPRGGRE